MVRSYIEVFNPFELIFVYDKTQWSSFILFYVSVQFSKHYLLKKLFSPLYISQCIEKWFFELNYFIEPPI